LSIDIHHKPVDTKIESRDIKRLLKAIEPEVHSNYSVYYFVVDTLLYTIVALGKPEVEYSYRVHYDTLSNLKYKLMEAVIKHCGREFVKIEWSGSRYKLKISYSPFTIRVVIDKP